MTEPTEAPRYKLVPVEPTEDMYVHGMEKSVAGRPSVDDESYVCSIWNAMLAVVPELPALQPTIPEGFVLAPDFRGYAHLGVGAYLIQHSAKGEPAELVVTLATEEEKAGRTVGDDGPNPDGASIQPETIAVRLRFENVAGLDALEKQLRHVRETHFSPASANYPDAGPTMDDARAVIRQLVEALEAVPLVPVSVGRVMDDALAAAAPFLDGREG